MGLSRLDNFLKSVRGTILYVDPNSLDSTDSIENQGNSLTRPFKTIQRALIEAARFSYQRGLNNDRFGKTTILLYPGDHIVDNRPGWIPDGANNFRLRDGTISNDFLEFDLTSNFDITTSDNELYKLNSIHGGVIVPRGTSIVGLDLRKTKIRPKYVPDPTNDNIQRSTIFRVTGGCYFWQFSIFDADPNSNCFIDYTSNLFVPNFSHHKLSCFEYADGVNDVKINDPFIGSYSTDRTDLEMYYEKVGLAYGQSSGRAIPKDYPDIVDIQPKIDEYRIVGPTGGEVGITSIRAGDGLVATNIITVTTASAVSGLDVDTAFRIRNVSEPAYNGQFVVIERIDDKNFKYQVQNTPSVALPSAINSSLTLSSDTVTSASPYIFNLSLRSVYGMCGVLADGDKASGFKSMVIAQFTGISLQKDDNAFVKYDSVSGTYKDTIALSGALLSNDSRAIFKPSYRNFHIKTINEAFIQNVSIFAIGYAEHFSTETGGDQSVTNSNSNFGSKAFVASGFRRNAFPQDDLGYITHIIPPKEVPPTETSIEFDAIDVSKTIAVASVGNLYLYNQTNPDIPPENVIEGYRIGARENDTLNLLISSGGSVNEYSARIVMPNSQSSSEKKFTVARTATENNINDNTITLTSDHTFLNGESVRVISDNGYLPDGLVPNTVYYAITNTATNGSSLADNQLKLAKTETDAFDALNAIKINKRGGVLTVVSRVSDKNSGDIGHPIQFDSTNNNNQWYINVSTDLSENNIYSTIVNLGSSSLGSATSRTYFKRKRDNRSEIDTLYRVRYVIPKSTSGIVARPPTDVFVIQESNASIGSTDGEIQTYYGSGSLTSVNQQRNFRLIANAEWSSNIAKITTELPHNLSVGSQVELINIRSTNNTSGISNSGFNGTYNVVGISSAKEFSVNLLTDPGTFTNNTSARTTSLPYFKRKQYKDTYYIYRNEEAQKYIAGQQDGIYYFTLLNASNSPTQIFADEKFSQPVKELYPQVDRDNPKSDPDETTCAASLSLIGEVVVDDVRNSITKETVSKFLKDSNVGVSISNIISGIGRTTHTIYTNIDHGLNRLVRVSITNSGSGYGSGTPESFYNARLVSTGASATGQHATAKITVNASGNITDVKIMDGGSAYGIGDTLTVMGVPTTIGYSQAVLTVTSVYNNVGDVVRVSGVSGVSAESNLTYNNVYRITNVQVGSTKNFVVTSTTEIGSENITEIGATDATNAFVYLTGRAINISSLLYNNITGIATVTSSNNHGLKVDTKVKIVGANESIYNGDFIVTENVNLNTFKVNIGVSTSSPTATGTLFAYREGITSNDGVITVDNENLNGRMNTIYAGITTTLSSPIIDNITDQINLTSVSNLDVNIGDYLMIDDEIVRIKNTVSSSSVTGAANPIKIFRGVFGTKATTHVTGTVVRKINIKPVELRRHSIIRASGHTFEYVGYGPGNYSTAFPDKQDRQISPTEELLAQSTRKNGGINFYTGMNDRGISYSGNKKLSTVTGLEEIFDTPIQTVTGEDIGSLPSLNVVNAIEGSFGRSIRIDGGSDGKAISKFNGPVVFSRKITSTSPAGMEATSLFLQGNSTISRKYTVGISTPTIAGNPGDVVYYDSPSKGGHLGWIYTKDNEWYRFGNVSISKNSNIGIFDQIGIGIANPETNKLLINSGTSQVSVDKDGNVGIATSANNYKLNVNGDTNISGDLNATKFIGDGSGLFDLSIPASGWTNIFGGIYNTNLNNVGIGTAIPRFTLEVGATGVGGTSLLVNGGARIIGSLRPTDIDVAGIITATSYNFSSNTGTITAGIVTSSTLVVGTGGTVITTVGSNVGIGTTIPRTKLDVEGTLRVTSIREAVQSLSIVSNVVTVDLSRSQNFTLTANANVDYFVISNVPSESSSFTIIITQDAIGERTVDLDDFRTPGAVIIPVYWPGGGVLPKVTSTANRRDIYTFKTFDGGANWYGVVVGQNFTN